MKPGSSSRCKARARYEPPKVKRTTMFRCNQHQNHVHGLKNFHQAKHGKETLRWYDSV